MTALEDCQETTAPPSSDNFWSVKLSLLQRRQASNSSLSQSPAHSADAFPSLSIDIFRLTYVKRRAASLPLTAKIAPPLRTRWCRFSYRKGLLEIGLQRGLLKRIQFRFSAVLPGYLVGRIHMAGFFHVCLNGLQLRALIFYKDECKH